jgi:hypothetical protein
MRDLNRLNPYRDTDSSFIQLIGDPGDSTYGRFFIPSPEDRVRIQVIASSGDPPKIMWEHVSVSRQDRCPLWREMCFIKELFFKEEETVMQLHVPMVDWISYHPFCLHLWKPIGVEIPRPPSFLVGPKGKRNATRPLRA